MKIELSVKNLWVDIERKKNQDTNEKHIAAYGTSLKIEKIYRTDRYCFLVNSGFKREKLV